MKLLMPLKGSIQNPTFSPDGRAFLFNRFRHSYHSEAGSDIYVADVHDRERCSLITKGELEGQNNVCAPGFRSTWTQNGWIYFTTDFGGKSRPARIRPNGERFELIPLPDGLAAAGGPTASPSGEEIAVEVTLESKSTPEKRGGEIYVGAVDHVAGKLVGKGSGPSWSPDGKSLAWLNEGRVQYHDIETGDTRVVSPDGQRFHGTPTWHAEPGRILVGGANALYQVTTTGAMQTAYAVEHPRTFWVGNGSWSPDFNGKHRRLLCEGSDRDDPIGGPGAWLEIY